MPKTDSKNK
jgi:mannose-6-phosphate isomerase-like protein (cupin superfamily)